MKVSRLVVYDFLSQRSLAVVGVSRSGKKFGNAIYRTLKQHGYKLFPIHPVAETVEGDRCYPDFQSLPERVGGVVLCIPPMQTEEVLKHVFEAGIKRVWMQQGSESYAALRYCEKMGINAVHGQCILMFSEPVTAFHGFHRWVWKLVGKYPVSDKRSPMPAQ
jgi:predicted CoA-binding protein